MTDKPVRWSPFMTALAVLGALVMPHLSLAHPLGNFSISHYTAIRLEPDAVVIEFSDAGHLADPLAGRLTPPLESPGGRGLYLVNQLCDLVQVRSGLEGTEVRIFAWR